MPRTARDQSATGIYHVMIRGINRQDIFETPEDYRKFIETLASLREAAMGTGTEVNPESWTQLKGSNETYI